MEAPCSPDRVRQAGFGRQGSVAAVASGRADAFDEDDPAPWDWAAGALLASEAGAGVAELPGPGAGSGVLAAAAGIAGALVRVVAAPEGR